LELLVSNQSEVVVELDVFSGRPNPEWRLTGAAREQLLKLLRASPTSQSRSGPESGLGYRGFVVRILSGATKLRMHVGGGIVEWEGFYGRDDGRKIEKWLVDTIPLDIKAQFQAVLPPVR
jgi:hypothetical protein